MKDSQRKLVTVKVKEGEFYATLDGCIATVHKKTLTPKDPIVGEYNVIKKKWIEHETLSSGIKEVVAELATNEFVSRSELSA